MSILDNLSSHIPLTSKKEAAEVYFALNIGLSEVTAAVWSLGSHKVEILSTFSKSYSDDEDLIEKARLCFDEALGDLEIEPDKILFGVPEQWNEGDSLKESYLKLLNKISREFDLTPLAYVTTIHSVAHLLQKKEGVPPTAILLGIGDFVEATLLRGGKTIESKISKRSEILFKDIEQALLQFTEAEVLPSKMLLYSSKEGEDLNKLKDELMSYPWMQKLSFLHFPKIDLLDEDILIKSVVSAGVTELDPEIDLTSFLKQTQKPLLTAMKKELPEESMEPEETEEEPSLKHHLKRHPSNIKPKEDDNGEEGGFVTGDIEEARKPLNYEQENNLAGIENKKDLLSSVNLAVGNLKLAKSLPSFSFNMGGLGKFLLLGFGVLFLIVGAYIFLVKASITIFIEPKVLENTAQVIADPKATGVDEEKKIIPGELVEVSVSGSGKASATGSKEIGDPAKGTVLVYNATSSSLKLSAGDTLKTDSGLKFKLDTSLQVASKSASAADPPSHSDAVGITAVAIGPDGNIPAGTELSVGSYTKAEVVAKVDQTLSGGTSKTVTVVTTDDQKKLQEKVTDELRQKAVEELQGKMEDGKKVITQSLAVLDSKYNFSKQVNDTASDFTLSATAKFRGTAYADMDLGTIVSKLVSTNVPEGYELNLQETETSSDVSKVEKDGKLIFDAKFKAKLMPKMDIEELKTKIKGKTIADAAETLKLIDSVLGSEISLTPSLPSKISRLPFLEKNISITITPK